MFLSQRRDRKKRRVGLNEKRGYDPEIRGKVREKVTRIRVRRGEEKRKKIEKEGERKNGEGKSRVS